MRTRRYWRNTFAAAGPVAGIRWQEVMGSIMWSGHIGFGATGIDAGVR